MNKTIIPDHYAYRPVRPLFQLIMIVITGSILAVSLYRSSLYFTSTDPTPAISRLTPKILEGFAGNPSVVRTGIFISDFLTFDPVKNDFIFKGIVWFELDPAIISIDMLKKFTFERAEILERSEPYTRIINDKLFVRYDVKVRFKTQLQYSYFPFDDHRIFLQLVHGVVSPDEMIFESSSADFIVHFSTAALGWTAIDRHVVTGFIESDVDPYDPKKNVYHPSVLFSIDYQRNGIRYALTILLPLLLIFFVSLFIFSIDAFKYSTVAVSLAAGSVTALLAYRFVIENFSPAVGYFMLSDYIFFLFLFASSFVFFFSIILVKLTHLLKKIIIMGLHTFVSGVCIYLFFFWLH
ncbi:MAG: hypothetical protein WC707_04975 [Candidatus Babeliaceae bacterium]